MILWCVPETIGHGPKQVWHIVAGPSTDDFTPILCGVDQDDGITHPGPRKRREPTCEACLAAREANRTRSTR